LPRIYTNPAKISSDGKYKFAAKQFVRKIYRQSLGGGGGKLNAFAAAPPEA
jgi:hypothetical protein